MVFSSLFGGPPNIEKLKAKGDINGLIKALGYEKDADIRQAAAQALRDVDRTQLYLQAKEPFIDALKDEDWRVRHIAVQVLAELGEPDTLEPLVKALEDQNPNVREAAVEALAAKLGSSRLPENAALAVVEFFGRTGDARYVNALISAFKHAFQMNHLSVQHAACDALIGLGAPAVQPLSSILGERVGIGTKSCHREVIEILVKIGDRQAIAPLITVLKEDPYYKFDAAKALGEFGGEEAVEALLSALSDKQAGMRAAAAEALGKVGDTRAIEPLNTLLTTDEEEIVRKAAATALRETGHEQAFDILETAIKNRKWVDLKDLARTLAQRAEERDRELLKTILYDTGAGEARLIAARALAQAGDSGAFNILFELVQGGDDEAARVIEDIADIRAIEPLIEALSQPSTRVTATRTLGKIGDARAVSPLLAILTQEPVITETGFPAAAQQRLGITTSKSAALSSLQAILQRDVENIDSEELSALANLNDLEGWEGVVDSTGYLQGVEDVTLDCSPLRSLAKQELSRRGAS